MKDKNDKTIKTNISSLKFFRTFLSLKKVTTKKQIKFENIKNNLLGFLRKPDYFIES